MPTPVSRMKKSSDALQIIFYVGFVLVFAGLIVSQVIRYWFVIIAPQPDNLSDETSGLTILAFVTFTGIVLAAVYACKEPTKRSVWLYIPIFITMVAVGTRAMIILVMGINTVPISDWAIAWHSSRIIPELTEYHAVYSSWVFPLYYLRLLPTVSAGVAMNILWTAVAAVLLYYLVINFGLSSRIALMSAIFFLFWPAHLFYTIVLAPEFVHISFMLGSFLSVIIAHRRYKEKKRIQSILLFCGSGLLLAISNCFKSVAIIYIFAWIIVWAIYMLREYPQRAFSSQEKISLKLIATSEIVFIFIGTFVFFAVQNGAYLLAEYTSGMTINRHISSYYTYVGLRDGYWTPEAPAEYWQIVQYNNGDFYQAAQETNKAVVGFIKKPGHLSFEFFLNKIRLTWMDNDYLYFINATMDPEGSSVFNLEKWQMYLYPYTHLYYLTIMLLVAISSWFALWDKKNYLLFFCFLVFTGYTLALLIIEAQPRYKCILFPLLAFCAAYAVDQLVSKGKKLAKRVAPKIGRIEPKVVDK